MESLESTLTWTFRLRIQIHVTSRLTLPGDECEISLGDGDGPIRVSAWRGEGPIATAEWLILEGTADSSDGAVARGMRLTDSLRQTFAKLRITANFGREEATGLQVAGQPVVVTAGEAMPDDVHGLMIYPSGSALTFPVLFAPTVSQGQAPGRFEEALATAAKAGTVQSPQERVAFALYSGYQFEIAPAARLIMLVIAVETILPAFDRSAQAVSHVEQLIGMTKDNAALTASERNAITSSLAWQKKESITRSGVLLMESRLPGRLYGRGDEPASTVWKRAYGMRSDLAHGRLAEIGHRDIEQCAHAMFHIVGDLLSGPLLSESAL